jgi:hypothetical protein
MVDSRSDVNELSISTFLEHPIGGYLFNVNDRSVFDLSKIGQHSHVLDTFAFFGFFIGIFMCVFMFYPFFIRLKKQEYKLKIFTIIVGFAFFILITANNLTPTMGYAAFFVFPTVFDVLKKTNNT